MTHEQMDQATASKRPRKYSLEVSSRSKQKGTKSEGRVEEEDGVPSNAPGTIYQPPRQCGGKHAARDGPDPAAVVVSLPPPRLP